MAFSSTNMEYRDRKDPILRGQECPLKPNTVHVVLYSAQGGGGPSVPTAWGPLQVVDTQPMQRSNRETRRLV
ncbi:unnamed protein product [Fusarium graminearum]|nr:unnamed protein product [Fusarium graminearum]